MATKKKTIDINTFHAWVSEATFAQQEARAEQWTDEEFRDGTQWSTVQLKKAEDGGINPMTANRIFPVVNMLQGLQATNPLQITAKGRSKKDTENALAISEGIQFVSDQCEGEFLLGEAFKDELIPGIGWIYCGFSPDPRQEKVRLYRRDWKEMWFDPYSSPWVSPETCRYMFFQRWMDIDDVVAMFPEKEYEIRGASDQLSGTSKYMGLIYDEAQRIEDLRRTLTGSGNYDSLRNRVRPIEIWYTVYADSLFAIFPDGRVIEVDDKLPMYEQFAIVKSSQSIVKAAVKKMKVCTILGDTILQDVATPFPHDEFPFIPFVGYIDRFGNPYGVPRNLRGMQIEVNERRSMALALLSKKQVIAETSVVDKPEKLQALYEEGQKPDGMLIVQPGQSQKIQLVEHGQLSAAQMQLMMQSENEIVQISGSAGEMQFDANSQRQSGRSKEETRQSSTIINATLFQNMRRSIKRLGEQTTCLIQGEWTKEKVIRITDKLTGTERFVELNKRDPTGSPEIKNNITQCKVDIVVADAPMTDTVREKNMDMIIEWVKKSPPEIIPHLINVAFELSSIPNKEILLSKLKPILGVDPRDEDMTTEEIKQKAIQNLQVQAQKQQEAEAIQQRLIALEIENKQLSNAFIAAETEHMKTKPVTERMKTDINAEKVQVAAFKTGADVELKRKKHEMDIGKFHYDAFQTGQDRKDQNDQATFDRALAVQQQQTAEKQAAKPVAVGGK
jgi:hypothetical protein